MFTMKGVIAFSIGMVTLIGITAANMPVLAQQATQHTQKQSTQQTAQMQSTPQAKVTARVTYKCDQGKGFSVVYRNDNTAEATFGSKVIMLDQVKAASGARYSDGSVTLYTKGDTAFVEVGDNRLFANCVATGSGVHGMW
jgi:membrane-bound inhibitor of C-type lysozyme